MFSVQETAVASYASARQKPARTEQPSGPDDFGSLVDNNSAAADTNRSAPTDQPVRSGTDDRGVTSADTRAARPDRADQAAQNADDNPAEAGSKDSTAAPGPAKTASNTKADGETRNTRHTKKASETEAADQTTPATATPTPSAQDASVLAAASVATSAKPANEAAAATDAAAIAENTKATGSIKTSSAQSAGASAVAAAQPAITAQEEASAELSSPDERPQAAAGKTTVDAKGASVAKILDDSVVPQNAKTAAESASEDAQAAIPAATTLAADAGAKSAAVQPTAIKSADPSTVKGSALTKADDKSASPQTVSAKGKDASRSAGKTETGDADANIVKDDNTSGGNGNAKAATPDKPTVIHDSQPSVQPLTNDSAALQQAGVQQQPAQLQPLNAAAAPTAQLNATLSAANMPVPLNGLAADIALKAAGGNSRFEIRLDPAELGRIDVRLDVDKHGQVTSHLTVERPATLDMLRKDAPQLQQALEDAGLKTGNGGLQFSLRDQSSSSGQQNDSQSGRNAQRIIITEDTAVPAQVAGQTYGRARGSSAGVDISI